MKRLTIINIETSKDGLRCSKYCPGYNYDYPHGDAWCSLFKNKDTTYTALEEGSITRAPRRCKACLDAEQWVTKLERTEVLTGLANQLCVASERLLHSMVDDLPKRIEALRQATVAYARVRDKK